MLRRRPGPAALLVAGYALLIVSWTFSNSPGSSPDEPAHLTKALGVASGQWTGAEANYAAGPEFGPAQLPWINSVTRSFDVPRTKTFGTITTCNAFRPEQPSTCIPVGFEKRAGEAPSREKTHVGAYQPAPYVPLGFAARLAPGSAAAAVYAGRLVVAGIAITLIALAAACLWSSTAGAWSLVGLTVGITPMVVFLGSSLSPNGMEIAGGLAMVAGVIRLARDGPTVGWAAIGVGGTVMALSRATGPVWAASLLMLAIALIGPRRFLTLVNANRKVTWPALAAIGLAGAATFAWELAVMPGPPRSPDLGRWLDAFAALPELMRQAIGVFGWLDTGMPALAYAAWRLGLLVIIGLALLVGTRRDRLVLLGSMAAVLAATIGLALFAVFPTGFGTQGRYTLPIAVAVPLLAGEILARRREQLRGIVLARLPATFAIAAATIHLLAWYTNARRNAVGTNGPLFFLGSSEWSPPAGWPPWGLLAATGTVLITMSLAGGTARRRSRPIPLDKP